MRVKTSVQDWVNYIKNNCPNPDAKVILYLNWPYTDSSDFDGDMLTLFNNYKAVARDLGVLVYPAGKAFDIVYKEDGESYKNQLYTDNRHPSLSASFLSACVIYNSIFDESPVGINYKPNGLNDTDATRIKQRANQAYETHKNTNDYSGKIYFQLEETYNNGHSNTPPLDNVSWSVNGGGTINSEGVFTSNGTTGTFTVTGTYNTTQYVTTITINNAEEDKPILTDDYAEISISTDYTQDFDNIGTLADAALPQGWRIEKRLDAPRVLGNFNLVGNITEQVGGINMASNARNGLYNFGAGSPESAIDRAIGGISTGIADGTRGINIYLKLKNKGDKINSFDIEYDVEKYRNGNNSADFRIQLFYSKNGIDWTNAGDNFKTSFQPDANMDGLPSVPSETRNVTSSLDIPLENNEDIYLAWNYSVNTGTSCQGAPALGIDNIKISGIGLGTYIRNNNEKNLYEYDIKTRVLTINEAEKYNCKIFDISGGLIHQSINNNSIFLDNLKFGIYFLVLKNKTSNTINSFKIVL